MDLKPTVNSDPRRNLPSVDRLIRRVGEIRPEIAPWAVRCSARDLVDGLRAVITRGDSDGSDERPDFDVLVDRVAAQAALLAEPHPRPVINATGVVLHTNLGRAPLAEAAREAVAEAIRGYSNLELDLETGRRGSRLGQLERKLCELSGAEAAHVVNNNAAAVLLALNTLGLGRAAIVSRGELVEIGGSFRVPAIMERSGVRLVEVGTTNRTHLTDYEAAIGADTALLLKVHRSNFEQRGFIAEVEIGALAELAHQRNVPLVEDLGSGTLLDLGGCGLPDEAFAPGRLRAGVDVVCFSGDKLLGGPQAGILLGSKEQIGAMRRNPLARALRIDKLTIAALDATLDLMMDESRSNEIPVVAGLRRRAEELEPAGRRLLEAVSKVLPDPWRARLESTEAAVGGGSLPEHRLGSWAVVVTGGSVTRVATRLRQATQPVLARVRDDALWLDVRTIDPAEMPDLLAALEFATR